MKYILHSSGEPHCSIWDYLQSALFLSINQLLYPCKSYTVERELLLQNMALRLIKFSSIEDIVAFFKKNVHQNINSI